MGVFVGIGRLRPGEALRQGAILGDLAGDLTEDLVPSWLPQPLSASSRLWPTGSWDASGPTRSWLALRTGPSFRSVVGI